MSTENGLVISILNDVFSSPNEIFQKLEEQIDYLPPEQCKVCIFGKRYQTPRQMVAFGDAGLSYTFSGLTVACKPWTPLLLEIKKSVEQLSGFEYNFVLLNRYRNGDDCIGQHKDAETDLDKDYPISSVSLGESRKIIFKRRHFKDFSLELEDNSLLIMKPPTNDLWTHGIPRQPERKGVRLNLTFRKIHPNDKRKNEETFSQSNKKGKKDDKAGGAFSVIPDNLFPLGEDVFVAITSIRGETLLHIRKYKKFNTMYYPTKEGVTLSPWSFVRLLWRPVPDSDEQLESAHFLVSEDIKVESTDWKHFNFIRNSLSYRGETNKFSIVITKEQWEQVITRIEDISSIALDFIYREMDFKTIFESIADESIDDFLPKSLDVGLGTDYVTKLLFSSLCDVLKENHGLTTPETYDDNIIVSSNTIMDFNLAAILMQAIEIANMYRERLWEKQYYLALSPTRYVTATFLKSVELDKMIRKAREELCPPCNE